MGSGWRMSKARKTWDGKRKDTSKKTDINKTEKDDHQILVRSGETPNIRSETFRAYK